VTDLVNEEARGGTGSTSGLRLLMTGEDMLELVEVIPEMLGRSKAT
jgi:hypothetical protein